MAGGYCCITKSKGTAITTVGAMIIAVFAVGVLICASEYEGTADKPFESKMSLILEGDKEMFSEKVPIMIATDKPIQAALVSSIVICVLGMIFGALIMYTPQTQMKPLCIAWMVFGGFAIISLFILGVFIAAKQNPVGILSSVPGKNAKNATTPTPATTTTIPSTVSTVSPETPDVQEEEEDLQNASSTDTQNATSGSTPNATSGSTQNAATDSTQNAATGSTQNAATRSTQNSGSGPEKSPAGSSRRSHFVKIELDLPFVIQNTFPRKFLITPIYLLCSCAFLIWTVAATGSSMNDISS